VNGGATREFATRNANSTRYNVPRLALGVKPVIALWDTGVGYRCQVLPRAPPPVVAAFRYTVQRLNRAIGNHFGINYWRVSRIVSGTERKRARGKT